MKRKERVLIDAFHLLNALTGIRTYTTQLCKGIEDLNSEDVEYLIYPNWRWLNETTFLRGKVNVLKKIINHIIYFVWKQVFLPILIFFKQVDVVVAPDYLLPYVKFGAKSIAVFHDVFYWELKGKYNPLWRWYFLNSVRLGLNKKSKLVVTSNYIAKKVQRQVDNQHEIAVVYQSSKSLNYGAEKSLNLTGLPMGSNYFLHVGIFEERKNLRVLIKAFNELLKSPFYRGFYLVLVGSRAVGWFHDDYASMIKLIKELDIEHRVIMPGFVSNDDLGSIYRAAFAYVFPSKEEGFGIPVVEAMKAEVPIIISSQEALMEVADGCALVFDMNSEDDLHKEMLKLESSKVREDLVEKGKSRALNFSQSSFANQFHSVICDILK